MTPWRSCSYLAGKGVPVLYIPGSIAGLSGPATVAGSVAMINAGVLAGLVIAQLKREGAPFIVKAWGGGGLDMRTMVYGYAGPDSRRAAEAMGAYYDLPTFALAGASDAKVVDQQAGARGGAHAHGRRPRRGGPRPRSGLSRVGHERVPGPARDL